MSAEDLQALERSETPEPNGSVKEQENMPVSPPPMSKNNASSKLKGKVKKRILIGFLSSIGITGIGIGLSGPFQFLSIYEHLTDKFSYSETALGNHHNLLSAYKLEKSVCSGAKCKFQTMSEKELAKLDKAGFKVYDESGKLLNGSKGKVSAARIETEIDGVKKSLDASNFIKETTSDAKLRASLKKVYNPKFMSTQGKAWSFMKEKFKVSKAKESAETTKELARDLEESVEGGMSESTKNVTAEYDEESKKWKTSDGQEFESEEKAKKYVDDAAKLADNTENMTVKDVSNAAKEMNPDLLGKIGGGIKDFISLDGGIPNYFCGIYNSARMVNLGSKTIRTAKYVRYAIIFMQSVEAMKMGDYKSQDMEMWGKLLNDTGSSDDKTVATDSFGLRWVMNGELNDHETVSSFMLGGEGPMDGVLAGLTSVWTLIPGMEGKTPTKACKFIRSNLFQYSNIIAGLVVQGALAIATGGVGDATLKGVLQGAKSLVKKGIMAMLKNPRFYADGVFEAGMSAMPGILNGIVTEKMGPDSIFAESAGNVLTGGAGAAQGQIAQGNGLGPLSKPQAVAYAREMKETQLANAEEDRATLSPFDISSPNTVMGSIAFNLMPRVASITSGWNFTKAVSSIFSDGLFAMFAPFKVSAADRGAEFEYCGDKDYADLGLAGDPYCNLVYGLAETYDPGTVFDYMISNGHIKDDENATPQSQEFKDFEEFCVNRVNPFGDSGDDNINDDVHTGKICLQDKEHNPDYKRTIMFYNFYEYETVNE